MGFTQHSEIAAECAAHTLIVGYKAGGLERDDGVSPDIQEVSSAQVVISGIMITEDTACLHLDTSAAQLSRIWVITKATRSLEEQTKLLLKSYVFGFEGD
jgi:hypothetical protein